MLNKIALCLRVSGFVFLATLIPPRIANAEDHSDPWYPVESHANCKYLNQVYENPQKSRWSGACADGFVQGEGTITFETEFGEGTIIGVYEDGVTSGYNEIISWLPGDDEGDNEPQRYEYKGETKNGLGAGRGTLKISDWFDYSGQFENSKPHGYGELKSKKITYSGMFKDGEPYGLGVYTLEELESQITLTGEFKNWVADGAGVLEINMQPKLRIIGVFRGPIEVLFDRFEVVGPAIMESEGKKKYRYTGEIFEFKMHGYGIQVYDTGHRHEGMFQKGRPHGLGIAIDPNGNSCEGEWNEGTLIGRGKGVSKDQSAPCVVDENGDITLIIVG